MTRDFERLALLHMLVHAIDVQHGRFVDPTSGILREGETPRRTPRLGSQKRRKGGPTPGPYYSKLVTLMTLLYDKEFEKFENGTPAELRRLVKWRFKNDSVKGYPKSRNGLDKAIAKAKREVIDSVDRI